MLSRTGYTEALNQDLFRISLAFKAPDPIHPHTYGLPIQKYLIWYKPIDLNSYERAEAGPNDLSFVLDNLHNGQEYELLIAAVNEVGMSENATERWVTPAGIPDGEPLNIRYTIFKIKLVLWSLVEWESLV
ncbi:tyrosine-protein phosphatase Lar-like [Ditylenchus destructor]|uniref:Tyrosine-protein phosphatase Lar-like n=1 Tax=Ditylenchus destructor TaxID=166010 RepID=A0AAD4MKX1_9BILA|nr:tyrosine-protein phosphatase Lar-like [Ditylenchus destructor]